MSGMTAIPISIPGFSDPFSSWTHLLAAAAALLGVVFLTKKGRGNTARLISLIIFSVTLVFLFSMSGVFHMLERGGVARDVLQRLDHAGIWTLIAGTFTPIHIILFRGHWRWAVLLLVWALAITGLVLEVVFFTHFPEAILLSMFLGLGWMGTLSGVMFVKTYRDPSVKYLAAGGILYSIGAVFDFIRWPTLITGVVGPHEVFHVFVVLGALAHWIFVYEWSSHPVANEITFDVRVFPSSRAIAKAVGEGIELEAESIDQIKILIREAIARKFHASVRPLVRLRYTQEEHL